MFKKDHAKYGIHPDSKVGKYLEDGTGFYIVDMEKKKVYFAGDLRLKDLLEKLEKDTVFIVKEVSYCD